MAYSNFLFICTNIDNLLVLSKCYLFNIIREIEIKLKENRQYIFNSPYFAKPK